MESVGWHRDAACRNFPPDWWWPEELPNRYQAPEKARTICFSCPAQKNCLDYAMSTRQKYGIWGGYTPDSRMQLARGRNPHPDPRECRRCGRVFGCKSEYREVGKEWECRTACQLRLVE